ncbi:hypothetical protein CAPTEDRAFT_198622 [Capitella teleta]|uniref:Arrestin C-terminal-like domain-containing protein n=1 Tax=Capitella teleta TaxID=283909 RepID=R7UYV1_CAPTE|nr:hypothetical protein CAPTEDRAFT_198622 [Capitella teleta]|eukprot:ELU11748.1 hypothetical protein CAPTEDRAFT_198622 [Capitella teleta]
MAAIVPWRLKAQHKSIPSSAARSAVAMATQETIAFDAMKQNDFVLYTRAEKLTDSGQRLTSDLAMAISNFHIQLDNVNNMLTPGEVISGRVIMDVWSALSIRFVEFVIQGRGIAREFDRGKPSDRPISEDILDKRIEIMSPPTGRRTMTLAPGKYVSKFSFTLPENIPYSIRATEMRENDVTFEITYEAKANIAADIESQTLSPQMQSHLVKIIKSCRKPFTVLPSINYFNRSEMMKAVSHGEQITTCCSSNPTSVLFTIDRQLYQVGDSIKFQLEVLSPKRRSVKHVVCSLNQEAMLYGRKPLNTTLLKLHGCIPKDSDKIVNLNFDMPLLPTLLPSLMPFSRLLRISYHINIRIQLRGWGGDILMDIPLLVAPPSVKPGDPELPVFSKPVTLFPYLSEKNDEVTSGSTKTVESIVSSVHRRGEQRRAKVTTRYVNDFRMCNNCTGCCGVGIHE